MVYTAFDLDNHYLGTFTETDYLIAGIKGYLDTDEIYFVDKPATVDCIEYFRDERNCMIISDHKNAISGIAVYYSELNELQVDLGVKNVL